MLLWLKGSFFRDILDSLVSKQISMSKLTPKEWFAILKKKEAVAYHRKILNKRPTEKDIIRITQANWKRLKEEQKKRLKIQTLQINAALGNKNSLPKFAQAFKTPIVLFLKQKRAAKDKKHKKLAWGSEKTHPVNSLAHALENARVFVASRLKVPLTKVNFQKKEMTVPLKFRGVQTQVTFSWWNDTLRITIPNYETSSEPCLDLRIVEKNNIVVGKIAFVRTRSSSGGPVSCKIPSKEAGAWMVNLADRIYCWLGLQKAFLEDDSQLVCNKKNVNFLILRILQGKFSWYETFGYRLYLRQDPKGTVPNDYDRKQYEQDARMLRSYPVDDLLSLARVPAKQAVSSISAGALKVLDEARLRAIDSIEKAREFGIKQETLGPFMSKIWESVTHCSLYVGVISFIETAARPDIDPFGKVYSFAGATRRLSYIGSEYLKELQCSRE